MDGSILPPPLLSQSLMLMEGQPNQKLDHALGRESEQLHTRAHLIPRTSDDNLSPRAKSTGSEVTIKLCPAEAGFKIVQVLNLLVRWISREPLVPIMRCANMRMSQFLCSNYEGLSFNMIEFNDGMPYPALRPPFAHSYCSFCLEMQSSPNSVLSSHY
jgi:hypothetical protein